MLALLDLDETLVDRRGAFAEWAEGFVSAHGLSDDDLQWLKTLDATAPPRDLFFERVHQRYRLGPSAALLWDSYREQMPGLAQPFPGVIPELTILRDLGWRLVVVTNGRTDNQLGKLRRTGLSALLDGWSISEDVGARKPSPAFFSKALASAGREAREPVWLVGDNPIDDIDGGRREAFSTIWVSHGNTWPGSLPAPTLVRDSTEEALRCLRTQT